jgi:predicted metal-dependent hydrolase
MAKKTPQLTLRLDAAAPDPAQRWHDGAAMVYLGDVVTLHLGTARKEAVLDQSMLHLPLPPEATPRQIQDAAEAWLRREAARLIGEIVARQSARQGRAAPDCSLSFATRASWAVADGSQHLRCNWRLVEQPLAVIEQVLGQAVARLPAESLCDDLFALA